MIKRTPKQKLANLVALSIAGTVGFAGISLYKGSPKFYQNILMPVVHSCVDGEDAHRWAVWAAKKKLLPATSMRPFKTTLSTEICGIKLKHPVGLAAGFDKDAEAVEGLHRIGFSFVEIGSVTPLPQPGNPKKRVFRLIEDEAVINRYGFNSDGHDDVLLRIQSLRNSVGGKEIVLGVNLGKNKSSENATKDYIDGVKKFAQVADYLVINVSSPNTPGLRNLQAKDELVKLVSGVLKARDALNLPQKTPIFLKIAPDLNAEDVSDITDVVMNNPECKIDGFIVSNTTISRPSSLKNKNKSEAGGLSGKPLKNLSNETIKEVYRLTKGEIPIIGVGGISDGEDAYEKILYGASAVQIYTALVYQGPPVVASICSQLDKCLQKDGYQNVSDVVGAYHRK